MLPLIDSLKLRVFKQATSSKNTSATGTCSTVRLQKVGYQLSVRTRSQQRQQQRKLHGRPKRATHGVCQCIHQCINVISQHIALDEQEQTWASDVPIHAILQNGSALAARHQKCQRRT